MTTRTTTLLLGGALMVAACGDNAGGADNPQVDAGKRPDATLIDAAPDPTPDASVDAPPAPLSLNTNGGFETGDSAGWICSGNAACTVLNTGAHSGTYAGSATNLPNDYSGFRINVLPIVCPTDATCATGTTLLGRTLKFHGFIKPIGAATAIRLVLRWNCPAQAMGGYEWLQNINAPTPGDWHEYTREFVIPNCDYGAQDGNLYLYTGTVGATELHIDDLTITDVTP